MVIEYYKTFRLYANYVNIDISLEKSFFFLSKARMKDSVYGVLQIALLSQIAKKLENLETTDNNKDDGVAVRIIPSEREIHIDDYEFIYESNIGECAIFTNTPNGARVLYSKDGIHRTIAKVKAFSFIRLIFARKLVGNDYVYNSTTWEYGTSHQQFFNGYTEGACIQFTVDEFMAGVEIKYKDLEWKPAMTFLQDKPPSLDKE